MMIFIPHHPAATLDHMGYISNFFSDDDPRPAKEQIDERYSYGGGWSPLVPNRWLMLNAEKLIIKYPEDPPMLPICELRVRDERIIIYPHAVVMILQPDGSFEVARLD